MVDANWSHVDVDSVPRMIISSPGPRSQEMHARTGEVHEGLLVPGAPLPGHLRHRPRLNAHRRRRQHLH